MILRVRKIEKRISIKKGIKNSVHAEDIHTFVRFLKQNGMSDSIITKLSYYHYGDGTIDGTGSKRVSSEEYKKGHSSDIEEINAFFSQTKMIEKSVNRFILIGNNGFKPIDAILYGLLKRK